MTALAFQWEWHNQCGSGLTEAGALAGFGIFVAISLVVWLVAYHIERR